MLSGPGNTGVNFDVARDVSRLRCELELFFDKTESADAGDVVGIAQLDYQGSNLYTVPVLRAKRTGAPGTLRVALAFGTAPDVDLGNVPVGEWVHAFFETDILDGKWLIRAGMLQNGEGAIDAGARAMLPRFDRVFFGLAAFAPKIDWRVRYDNLVCRWQ